MRGGRPDRSAPTATMAIVKCPYCNRRFAAVRESRDHIQTVHPEGGIS